jgi:hypothetical protein
VLKLSSVGALIEDEKLAALGEKVLLYHGELLVAW